MQQRRIDRYLDTIMSIAASPQVDRYVIGYTSRPAWKRFQEYQAADYEHLVILEDKMLRRDALDLEKELQKQIKEDCDKRWIEYKKYHPEKVLDVYRRSAGGILQDENDEDRSHSVYMAWWCP